MISFKLLLTAHVHDVEYNELHKEKFSHNLYIIDGDFRCIICSSNHNSFTVHVAKCRMSHCYDFAPVVVV